MILAGVTFATANKRNTLSSCANELLRCRVDSLMECLLCQYTQFGVSYCSLCTLFVFVHCVRSSPRREPLRRAIINNSEYHKHDYNYRTRGSEERQRGKKKRGSWNGAPRVWHNETKNEQDCWAEFTELRAGFTNSRRRLSHQVSAECLCFTQAPERLRSGRAEPTHTTLPMEQRKDPSPGANYPPPCHQRPAVSFKNHQCRRCRLNRSGAGIVERLLMIQINSGSVMSY